MSAGVQPSQPVETGSSASVSHGISIKSKKAVRCPNPDCDPAEGCCVCEHTGQIFEWVVEDLSQPEKEFTTRARHSPLQSGSVLSDD